MNTHRFKDITVSSLLTSHDYLHVDTDMLMVDGSIDLLDDGIPARMQCLLMSMCVEAECRYVVDTLDYKACTGDIMIIGKGQTVLEYSATPDFKSISLVLSYDFFNDAIKDVNELSSLFLFARRHPVFSLEPSEVECIGEYYSMVKARVEASDHRFRSQTVRSLIATMIFDLSNAIYRIQSHEVSGGVRAEKIFTDFIRLVEENCTSERRVSWYSEQLCLSPKYLSETVKSVSHRTPNEWIDNYVMIKLRVLLRYSSCSIKEITQRMNFSSQSFLGKYFKEHTGMSPLEYRRVRGEG